MTNNEWNYFVKGNMHYDWIIKYRKWYTKWNIWTAWNYVLSEPNFVFRRVRQLNSIEVWWSVQNALPCLKRFILGRTNDRSIDRSIKPTNERTNKQINIFLEIYVCGSNDRSFVLTVTWKIVQANNAYFWALRFFPFGPIYFRRHSVC